MDMIPVLNQGREAIEQMIQWARDWGIVLEDEAIAKIAAFNDHLDEFSLRMQGAKNELMVGMVDGLEQLAEALDAVSSSGSFWETIGEMIGYAARKVADMILATRMLLELVAT